MRFVLAIIGCLLGSVAVAGHNELAIITNAITGHAVSSGVTPASVSSCGTGSPSVAGNDSVGVITIGSGTVTACTLNFKTAWSSTPTCVGNATNATAIGITTVSTSLVTFAIAASGSAKLYYHCIQ